MLWGAHNLEDAAASRVLDAGENLVIDNIQARLDIHEAALQAVIDLFAFRTTEYSFGTKSAGFGELQPLDEFGRARPSKGREGKQVQAPIYRAGDAIAYSYEARIKLTVQAVEDRMKTLMGGDAASMRRWLLSSLFTPGPYTVDDHDGHGALTVYGLANGEADFLYGTYDGADSTDTHYITQTNGIAVGADNPLPGIKREIEEHGDNAGGQVIVFIAPAQEAAVRALPDFLKRSDPNIQTDGGTVLTGSIGAAVPGEEIGYCDGCFVVKWNAIPTGYLVGINTGPNKPLALREHPEAELRGFREQDERPDWPYFERQFVRRAGFGCVNRTGAVVARVGTAGAYAPPTAYTAPRA